MAQIMFLISGTNYLSLLWLVSEDRILHLILTQILIWSPGQCLHKSQNLLQVAYLRVNINSHGKIVKMTRILWYLEWKCRKYAIISRFISHTASKAKQRRIWVKKYHASAKIYDTLTTKSEQNTAKPYPYFVEQSTYTHMKGQNWRAYLGYLNVIW